MEWDGGVVVFGFFSIIEDRGGLRGRNERGRHGVDQNISVAAARGGGLITLRFWIPML